jgi:ABC-2 type transport system ATP-binding protein
MASAIRTEALFKNYRSVQALRGLTLDVPENSVYGLVGPNGAGKTTAIKIFMNIIRPTTGRAEILGIEAERIKGKTFASIGYISENQDLPGWMRVDSFLAYMRPFYPTWDRVLENELVRQFDLPLKRRLRTLSRGMKMKAALASSLSYRPKLIVMDEPFSGLDPLVRDELIRGIQQLASQTTILVSSHDLAEVESFATHIGYLDLGQLRFSEELSSLTNRFREVEITLAEPPSSTPFPASWIHVASSDSAVRFVHSAYDPTQAEAEIRSLFSNVSAVKFSPMSLRDIFVALARTSDTRKTKAAIA